MIFLTGDIHGMINDSDRFEVWNFPEGDDLTRNDHVIVLGDFGLPSDLSESDNILQKLDMKSWTTLFIDGNHEYYPFFENLEAEEWHGGLVHRFPKHSNIIHLMRGEVYEIDGYKFFCMGGARSVDKYLQQLNGTWFPEEMPGPQEYENARRNLARHGWKVDFVLTHTCSKRILPDALSQNSSLYLGIRTDALTDFLDELEDRLSFTHWMFGHFHRDIQLDDKHSILYRTFIDITDTPFNTKA